MTTENSDERLAASAKQTFDESVESLDAATLSRLNQGRHKALAELQRAKPMRQWVRWAPATGIADAALITVLVMRGPDEVVFPVTPVTVSDFEILLDDEPLEMLEDLEFYSWIDSSDLTGSGDVG
jgi:hypothetical protein